MLDHVLKNTGGCPPNLAQILQLMDRDSFAEILSAMSKHFDNASEFAGIDNPHEIVEHLLGLRRKSQEPGCAVLSTVHSAVGQEWHTVFIPNCVHNTYPYVKARREFLDDEARLFRVALSRARERVVIGVPRLDGRRPLAPSEYLENM